MDGEGAPASGVFRQHCLQAEGQRPLDVPLEQVAEGMDGVALGGKFQIGGDVHQHHIGVCLLELPPQRDAVGGLQVHIQQRQLELLPLGPCQRLLAPGAEDRFQRQTTGGKVFPGHLLHLPAKGGFVVTDQYVHGLPPSFGATQAKNLS